MSFFIHAQQQQQQQQQQQREQRRRNSKETSAALLSACTYLRTRVSYSSGNDTSICALNLYYTTDLTYLPSAPRVISCGISVITHLV